jgi:hypothetical protein
MPYAYRSCGGYRLIYRLPEPYIMWDPMDREVGSAGYLAWCAYLKRAFDIAADPSCKDWTRLYWLPHATHEAGRHPEEWQTWGDLRYIGVWHCEPTAEDVALAKTICLRKAAVDGSLRRVRRWVGASQGTREGVLYHAFRRVDGSGIQSSMGNGRRRVHGRSTTARARGTPQAR